MVTLPEPTQPEPTQPVTDQDRDRCIQEVQDALSRDAIGFEEIDDRFEAIFAATSQSELAAVIADLGPPPPSGPPPPRPPAEPHPTQPATAMQNRPPKIATSSIFGDVHVSSSKVRNGSVGATSFFGDVVIDASGVTPGATADVAARSVFGDIKVLVADGATVLPSIQTFFGDSKERTTRPQPGGPTIRLQAQSALGDVRVYSLSKTPKGKLRKLWKQLHD